MADRFPFTSKQTVSRRQCDHSKSISFPMNEEEPTEQEINITRMEWLKCVGIALSAQLVNHWYWTGSGAFYPIVVWGAPLFGLVGIAGLIYPKLMNYPWLVIFTALTGLALGVLVHIRVYGV